MTTERTQDRTDTRFRSFYYSSVWKI